MLNIIADDQEHTIVFNGLPIKYILRENRLDNHNLIVIFSGFGAKSNITYDFRGESLATIRSRILWIKDDVFGNCSLYIGYFNNIDIEKSILNFILAVAEEYFIDKNNIILLGGSKGGSCSLYYGLKYHFKYIISSAPQIEIGSFLSSIHEDVFLRFIKNNASYDTIKYELNSLIYNLLDNLNINEEKYIYLFSSDCDLYENCNKISSKLIEKVKYFYHIKINSTAVWQHNMITRYAVQAISGILSCIDFNLQPIFNNHTINTYQTTEYNRFILNEQILKHELISELSEWKIENNKCFLFGYAFMRGIPSPRYGMYIKKLYFIKNQCEYSYTIGSGSNKNICSKKFYHDIYCNYNTGCFADIDRKGIDITKLEYGTYNILISIESVINNFFCKSELKFSGKNIVNIGENGFYILFNENGNAKLKYCKFISKYSPSLCTVEKRWYKNNLYHWEGIFVVNAIEIVRYGQCKWYIIFNGNKTYCVEIGMSNRDHLKNILDDYGLYQKCYYSTMHGEGIDISTFENGNYSIYVTLVYLHYTYSYKIDYITINNIQ